jgi:pimeloyl-ACP methyl ester carboxylesterase
MMSPRISLLLVGVAILGLPANASARQTKVGLAHGINSSAATWDLLRPDLLGNGFDVPSPPTLPWESPIASQVSGTFLPYLAGNGFGPTSLLAGHSQGGLVARRASRDFSGSLKGYVTIGTPNYGAAIASAGSIAMAANYSALLLVNEATIYFGFTDVRSNPNHYLQSYVGSMDSWAWAAIYGVLGALGTGYAVANLLSPPASFADMTPAGWAGASGFIADLNANMWSEKVVHRVAIRTQHDFAGEGYYGGPLRLAMDAAAADIAGIGIMNYGYGLANAGLATLGALTWDDPLRWEHENAAWAAVALGNSVAYFPFLWHNDLIGGIPNDGIVGQFAQGYPGQEMYDVSGLTHLQQTGDGRAEIVGRLGMLRAR